MATLLIDAVLYVAYTLPLYIIAAKSGHSMAWLAFVPGGNFYLMCDLTDRELWWIFLFFVPLINLFFYCMLWCEIAETTNKPAWIGILMVIPVVNLLVGYYMAIYEPRDNRI
ncbi:MAG TPA: DUF5684 domain-containing protein [Chthonomonadales bacterium]|nr:DUF5684 domain-containing protein [Chthonomonadales bacterium]